MFREVAWLGVVEFAEIFEGKCLGLSFQKTRLGSRSIQSCMCAMCSSALMGVLG